MAEFCNTVYVIFPEFFALSDVFKLPTLINEHLPKNKDYILVGSGFSKRAVELIESHVGNVKIINYGS
ncbi:hypothetical protein D3C78_1814700 [compost metagenome]